MALADDGGIIAVGTTGAMVPTRTARTDGIIARYQPDGQLDWVKPYDRDAYDMFNAVALTDDGSIIAVGSTSSDAGNLRDTGYGYDALIVRFTPDGRLVWAKTFGGSKEDEFYSVAVASDGVIIAVGETRSSDGDFPPAKGKGSALVARITPDGQLAWAKTYGGNSYERFSSVAIASDGGIVVAGDSSSTKGDFPITRGPGSTLLARLTRDGRTVWAATHGGESFSGVAIADDGGIVAAGYTGPGDAMYPASGAMDALVARFEPGGSLQWAQVYGGTGADAFQSVAVADDGSIIAAGSATMFRPSGSQDAFVASLAPDGQHNWDRTYDGPGAEIFASLAMADDGSIIAAGGTEYKDTNGNNQDAAIVARLWPDEDLVIG